MRAASSLLTYHAGFHIIQRTSRDTLLPKVNQPQIGTVIKKKCFG